MFYQHPQRFDSIIGKLSRVSLWTLVWVISCLQVRATSAACQDETASTDKNVVVREVKFRDGEQLRQVLGEVLVEAVDGGILLQGTDGRQWAIQPEEIENSRDVSEPLKPMTNDEMEKAMLAELPGGFNALRTDHYLIMYNTTKAYSQWTGNLLERLYKAHFAFWKKK